MGAYYQMNDKNVTQTGFDELTGDIAEEFRDEMTSCLRTESYIDEDFEGVIDCYIDRFVLKTLKDYGIVASPDDQRVEDIRNHYKKREERNVFQETLMGVMLYVISLLEMVKTLVGDSLDGFVGELSLKLVVEVGSYGLALDIVTDMLSSAPYIIVFIIWMYLETKLRNKRYEKYKKQFEYYNRHASVISAWGLLMFYMSGIVVYYTVIDIFHIDVMWCSNIVLVVRVFVVVFMALYPAYLIHHYSEIDERVAQRVRSS